MCVASSIAAWAMSKTAVQRAVDVRAAVGLVGATCASAAFFCRVGGQRDLRLPDLDRVAEGHAGRSRSSGRGPDEPRELLAHDVDARPRLGEAGRRIGVSMLPERSVTSTKRWLAVPMVW
jgi:hypothetical protein